MNSTNAQSAPQQSEVQKPDVIAFFDRLAPSWDAEMIIDDQTVSVILIMPASAKANAAWMSPAVRACSRRIISIARSPT